MTRAIDNRATTSTAWSGWQIVSPRCYGCLRAAVKFGKFVCYCTSRTISHSAYGDTCESYCPRGGGDISNGVWLSGDVK